MKNPLKLLGFQSGMSHVAFRRTVGKLENIDQASAKDGVHRLGHFVPGNGAVRPSTEGKGSRRENNASIRDLARYLKKHPDRFEPDKAKKALSGLKAVKNMKDIDLTFLAADFKGLIPPDVLAFDFAQARKEVCVESNKIWDAAEGVANVTSPKALKVSFDSPDQVKANEQAMKTSVIASGQRFAKDCLPGLGQRHPKDAKRLANSLNKELRKSGLTRSFEVDRLAGLVEDGVGRLAALQDELEALLNQKDGRDQDPGFHLEVKLLGEKIMASQSSYLQTLAFVANRLSDRDLRQLPHDFSLVTARFAKALVDFLKVQLTPGSLFMDMNRLAAESRELAQRRLTELEAQGPVPPVASADTLRAKVVDQMNKARNAYATFEDGLFRPQGKNITTSDEQRLLRQQIADGLLTNDVTTKLPLAAVKGNLFEFVPGRIRKLNTDLSDDVTAWKKSQDPVLLSRIRSTAQELNEYISTYLGQLGVLGHLLCTKPSFGDLTPELDAARLAAGNSMLQLKFLLEDPSGDLMIIQAYARQQAQLGVDEQLGRLNEAQPMAGETRPAQIEDYVDESSLPTLIPLAEPKTRPMTSPAALEIPAMDMETAALFEQVDLMEAELLAEFGQPAPSTIPMPAQEANRPLWLEALPSHESQQLMTPIRSSLLPNRQQASFLSSDDTHAFEEMLGQMDVANVSLATPRGRGEADGEGSLGLTFDAEVATHPDTDTSWRLAGRPSIDPARTNRMAQAREPNAVRMDKAADGYAKAWGSFVKKCLVPVDGVHGLSNHQRLVKDWWTGLLPKASYDPATHNADADMPLAYLEPGDFVKVFVTEWPRKLEERRQELKDLLLQKDRLKNRGADAHQRINVLIQQAANSLQQDLDRYSAQVNALATRLIDQKGFPGGVPASFSLATSDAGKSLQALGEALKAPMARAYRLVQDARERSVLAS